MTVPSPIVIANNPFETVGIVSNAITGTAPTIYSASTVDSFATITAAGYLNPLSKYIKANDRFYINYADTSVYPLDTGEASIFGVFTVQYDPVLGNYNLIPAAEGADVIASLGVHSAVYQNNGGSATTTISDPLINVNSVVMARWNTSATSVRVETVLPGNGTLTVVSSADPGLSTLSYISILPSTALQNLGVVASKSSVPGGSATVVVTAPGVTASSVVNVNFQSQTNAAYIQKALPGAGIITMLCSADPGAAVVEYFAVVPSTALTNDGLYAATYTNAGGSSTITITDANITAASIVTADFASAANTSSIYKVTPSASTLTVLASADPGASVVDYIATKGAEGAAAGPFLPLAGGQMTGSILLDRGTATSTAGAATINHQAGVVTTEALTTASGSAYSFTLTNARITASSIVLCQLLGGTNTKHGLSFTAVPSAGSCAISVLNNDISAAALNGTLIFGFVVI